MDPRACQDPRESVGLEEEEKMVCPGNLASGVKLGSRAWQADLERRGRQASQAHQDPRA